MKHIPFINHDIGISGIVPDGWKDVQPGLWLRQSSESDPSHLVQQRVGGLSIDDILILAISQESLDAPPERAGMIEGLNFNWTWYRGKASEPVPRVVDLALAQRENRIYIVVLGNTPA